MESAGLDPQVRVTIHPVTENDHGLVPLLAKRRQVYMPEHDDVVEAARKLGRPVRAVHEQASAHAHGLLEGER